MFWSLKIHYCLFVKTKCKVKDLLDNASSYSSYIVKMAMPILSSMILKCFYIVYSLVLIVMNVPQGLEEVNAPEGGFFLQGLASIGTKLWEEHCGHSSHCGP